MINIIGSAILGLVLGLIALCVYPEATAMGSVATLVLGVGGALLAASRSAFAEVFSVPVALLRCLARIAPIVIGRLTSP